jgi:enoyl-CoA hydratase
MELILAADITVAAKTAKIGVPTINLGGIPCWTATQLLPRIVGHSVASDILLTGRILKADECYRLHLVQYLTEKEDMMAKAMEVAETLADKSPHAIMLMRKAIKQGLELPLDDALELERQIFKDCYTSSDRTEATAAFLEKRPHAPYNNRAEFTK